MAQPWAALAVFAGVQPAASSRLAIAPKDSTLGRVQLRFLGLRENVPQPPFVGQRRHQTQQLPADRVEQFQALCMQPQALQPDQICHGPVEWTFAVCGVTNDGVSDVFHVAAQLVAAAGQGLQLHLGPAQAWKFTLRNGQLTPFQG
eukprot:gene12359-15732_t